MVGVGINGRIVGMLDVSNCGDVCICLTFVGVPIVGVKVCVVM